MKIELAGWTSEGLRCPDVEINLRNAAGAAEAIALIQAPNGTGKTTTLEMLKACMHGEATSWTAENIRDFRRHNDSRGWGVFTTELRIDDRPLTIELRLDFEVGKATYRTATPVAGGVRMSWDPPSEAKKFLDKRFLNLFIFDGEYAKRLLDQNESEAEYAIDALCQLYLLKDIADIASDFWDRVARKAPGRTRGARRDEYAKQEIILERISLLEKSRAEAIVRLKKADADVEKFQKLVDGRLSTEASTRELHAQAQAALVQAQADVVTYSASLTLAIRSPQALHPRIGAALNHLKDNLDKLRLPENTSAQFFDELVQSSECICGREMTADAADQIKLRAKDYLGEKEIGVINEIKGDIEKFVVSEHDKNPYEELVEIRANLEIARKKLRKSEQQLRALENKLIDAGDANLENWKSSLTAAQEDQSQLKLLLESISADVVDGDYRTSRSLPSLNRMLKETNQRISEITDTVNVRERTDILKEILQKASVRSQDKIKAELLLVCNERLKSVLINDLLQIENIDRSLKLANQKGASEGQTLSVGYVFLMSILNRGNHDFPLVVDSPAGKLSTEVRNQIGSLIPKLCSQFVAFTIDTEREGFVTALESTGKKIKYLTLFRKTDGTKRLMPGLPINGLSQTDTAVLVDGRDYFFDFNHKSETV